MNPRNFQRENFSDHEFDELKRRIRDEVYQHQPKTGKDSRLIRFVRIDRTNKTVVPEDLPLAYVKSRMTINLQVPKRQEPSCCGLPGDQGAPRGRHQGSAVEARLVRAHLLL